jgi:hypothetical protein
MTEITDDQMAEAVLGGLTEMQACECGVKHHVKLVARLGRYNRWQYKVPCPCGLSHRANEFTCKCGATTNWGPRAGLRTTSRTAPCWKKREKGFVDRIAELEIALAAMSQS